MAVFPQDTMVGSASLLQSLAGDSEKAASMLHSLAPEVPLFSSCPGCIRYLPGTITRPQCQMRGVSLGTHPRSSRADSGLPGALGRRVSVQCDVIQGQSLMRTRVTSIEGCFCGASAGQGDGAVQPGACREDGAAARDVG